MIRQYVGNGVGARHANATQDLPGRFQRGGATPLDAPAVFCSHNNTFWADDGRLPGQGTDRPDARHNRTPLVEELARKRPVVHDSPASNEDAFGAQCHTLDEAQLAGSLAFLAPVSRNDRPVVKRIRRYRQRLEGLHGVDQATIVVHGPERPELMFGAADDVATSLQLQLHHGLADNRAAWTQQTQHAKPADEANLLHCGLTPPASREKPQSS